MKFQGKLLFEHRASQLVRLNGTVQGSHKVIAVDRFLNEVIGTTTEGLDGEIMLTMASDQQRRRIRSQLLYIRQQSQPIHAGHLDIAHDGIVMILSDQLKRSEGGIRGIYLCPLHPQRQCLGKRLQQGYVVVNDENMWAVHH